MKNWAFGMMSNDEKRNILDQHKSLYNGYKTMQPEVSNTQPLYVQDFANDKEGVTVDNKFNVKKYMNVGINEQVDEGYMEEEKSMCSECGGTMMEGECMECGWGGTEMEEDVQQVEDLDNVEDLNLSDKFDYTEMEEDEEDPMNFEKGERTQSPHQVGPDTDDGWDDYDDGTGEFAEQVGGGTAPYQNFSEIDPAYNFVSGGPLEEDEPMDEYEKMESAWSDDDMGDGEELYPTFSKDEFVGMSKESGDMGDEEELHPTYSDDEFVGMSKESGDMGDDWEEINGFSDVDEDLKESVVKQKNRIMEMMNRMKGFN